MREDIKAALRYPMFVIGAMAVAIVIINIFVIPAFAKVFASFKAELPLMTRILIGTSDFIVALLAAADRGAGRRRWSAFAPGSARRRPLHVGPLQAAHAGRGQDHPQGDAGALRAQLRARGARAACRWCRRSRWSRSVVDNALPRARASSRCATASSAARASCAPRSAAGVFTPVVLQMVAVGEETGELDELMAEIADMYEREVEYEVKTSPRRSSRS